jgi:hypothetical protein
VCPATDDPDPLQPFANGRYRGRSEARILVTSRFLGDAYPKPKFAGNTCNEQSGAQITSWLPETRRLQGYRDKY